MPDSQIANRLLYLRPALRRFLKISLISLAVIVGLLLLLGAYIVHVSNIQPPNIADTSALSLQVKTDHETRTIGDNWLRHSRFGLYEMYTSGTPFEMGVKEGKLSEELIREQEAAFTDEIRRMVPSPAYLRFLKYMVGFMNRDLPTHIPLVFKKEIYGISRSAADSFQWIGSNYARILNYHAAHDIGHALQNMMLVGCTSFGAWGDKTADGSMLIGRNFDFWVGDRFAENKIVSFYKPQAGHSFVSITWGGFTGVVSGMNSAGLTVTINAARSDIPIGAATPVSLVAREVLQYAATLNEAITIARRRKMFVSESIMVGSAKDGKAIIIEKTPDELAIYDPAQDAIQCTNHYQSKAFEKQEQNITQIARSASLYRYQRLQQLLTNAYPLTPQKMAAVLRDRRGINGVNIGEGNEKAVNQMIAHHSIIFQPDSLLMWVSTAPWQMGEYVCYDLRKVLSGKGFSFADEIADVVLNIPSDSFLQTKTFAQFMAFRQEKMKWLRHEKVDTGLIVRSNPTHYDAWRIAGDYCASRGWNSRAKHYYREALKREIATVDEREEIEEKLGN